MPVKKHGIVWEADPHTLAKITLLRGYLNAYFPILGRSRPGQTILYVDGFAGPGEYTNSSEGSPVAALTAISNAIAGAASGWKAASVCCAFIEADHERFLRLSDRVASIPVPATVRSIVREMTFVEGIAELRRLVPRPFISDEPLFVFIDPFGSTQVPFGTVNGILCSPCSEVLINLDADGIGRIYTANNPNRDEQLTSIFGDESWRSALTSPDFGVLCRQVLELYRRKLRAIPNVKYTFSYEMRGRHDTLNYHLVFASQNPLGLEKMKEAMKKIDQNGGYCFSDGAIGMPTLFRYDQPKDFSDKLHASFVGQTVAHAAVRDYTLNETPFVSPTQMLKLLDEQGLIEVNRIKGSGFSEEHVQTVRFLAVAGNAKAQGRPPSHHQGELFGGN